jgi:hypothetical protein
MSAVGPSDGVYLTQSMIASANHLVFASFDFSSDAPARGGQVWSIEFFFI